VSEYSENIAIYTSPVDEEAVAGIVKHLGIALRVGKDASLVACSDDVERQRVRESWLEKKLGLTDADGDLEAAIGSICAQMSAEKNKSRVTFYYLLAEQYGKLADLH
jgi:Asp/Glu/hydantoin racemase